MLKSNKSNIKNKPKANKNIYLDYAASATPNPSSIHRHGVIAKLKLEEARKEVAFVLGSRKEEVIFTSGGTESNNLAIGGVVWARHEKNSGVKILPHIITTNIEHPSVLETYKMFEKRKLAEVSIVPVEENGIVDPKKIKKEIKKNTILVSVMYANNEIGTIQPIKEIAKEIRHYRKISAKGSPSQEIWPLLHTDAVQAVNYLDLKVDKLGVDLLSISGTKIEGSGRVGVLFKRKDIPFTNVFGGGDQEHGFRPGTENLAGILKFSQALKVIEKIKEKEGKRMIKLRDYFLKKILKLENKIIVNGDLKNRLPNNVNVTFPKIPSDLLVIELSEKGIMASSKSACESSKAEGSYVIKALCKDRDKEIGGVRFSLGKNTTKGEIDYTIKTLSVILQKLKKWYY